MIHVSRELSKLSLLRHFDAGSYTLEEITWSRRDQNSHKSTDILSGLGETKTPDKLLPPQHTHLVITDSSDSCGQTLPL